MIKISLLLGLLLLGGCQQSPPKQFFLLSAPTQADIQNTPSKAGNLIGIGPIHLPEYLDRLQMVSIRPGQALVISDQHYWAEPLDKGVARVLTLNLIQLNHTRSFSPFPWRSDNKPVYSLRVQIHSLNHDRTQASINATWELFDNQRKRNLTREHFVSSIASQAGPGGMSQAYSDLLEQLAREMHSALQTAP